MQTMTLPGALVSRVHIPGCPCTATPQAKTTLRMRIRAKPNANHDPPWRTRKSCTYSWMSMYSKLTSGVKFRFSGIQVLTYPGFHRPCGVSDSVIRPTCTFFVVLERTCTRQDP